jgi:hypothetical protein
MNSRTLVKQGSKMWQGVMKAWSSIQSGIEQQDPTCWDEITRQPLFGNRFLTNEVGTQWGTEQKPNLKFWLEKGVGAIKDVLREDGNGWLTFAEQKKLHISRTAQATYDKVIHSIPRQPIPVLPDMLGLWIASKEADGNIRQVYHITNTNPTETTVYTKKVSEQLQETESQSALPAGQYSIVRVARCGGNKRWVLDFNPVTIEEPDCTLWLWGGDWICNLELDPKEWQWRRVGALPETTMLNYSTKRGYRIVMKQNNHTMKVDAELEAAGYNSKTRAKFFNRIWHPYLPRKVSAMQWLILAEGLPVGAWRERVGLPTNCQLCPSQDRETLQHAFQDCTEIQQVWTLFRNTRITAGLPPSYLS